MTALLEGAAVAMNRFNRWPKEAAAERTEEQDEVTLAGGTSSGKPKR